MKRRDQDIIINEKQFVRSKIPSDRVLRFALNLGMISRENYDIMKAIGKSKQLGELMNELSIKTPDAFTGMLKKLLRKGLIVIEENRPTTGNGSERLAPMTAENEKILEEAEEEAHHLEDSEDNEGGEDDEIS